jgi:hypothetical protein
MRLVLPFVFFGALALAGAIVGPSRADACPSCAAGQRARSEVIDDHFGANLVVALLPFLGIGAICALVEAVYR